MVAGQIKTSTINGIKFSLVYCPTGEFWMGSNEKFGWGSQIQHQPVQANLILSTLYHLCMCFSPKR